MTKLLNDEQINAIVREASRGAATRRDGTTSQRIARAIEAAVLEAQGRQEPVAWMYYPKGVGEKYVTYTNPASLDLGKQGDQIAFIQPLYAAPVVQPGMVMVPREPTDEYRQLASANGVTFDSVADAAYRAVIAAAEGKE